MLQPNLFGSTDGDGKAIVLNKLYDHSFHAFIRQESEQLVGGHDARQYHKPLSDLQTRHQPFFLLHNNIPHCFE